MSAAWFGLLGVVVGGVISSLWSWLAVVRQELSDAMVAARLVDLELSEREASDGSRVPAAATSIWNESRAALAKVLGKPQWDAISRVYANGSSSSPTDIETARQALAELVAGKRYVLPQRWRNMFQ